MIRKLRKHFLKLFIATVLLTAVSISIFLGSEYVTDKAHSRILLYLEEKLQSKVGMERMEINWLRGSLHLRDVSIKPNFGREKEFVSAKGIRISFLPWWNIFRREIGVRSIELENPGLYLRFENGKVANLPSLDFLAGKKEFFKFKVKRIKVAGGRMELSYPERPMDMVFSNIDMNIIPEIDKGEFGFFLADSFASLRIKGFAQNITSMKGEFRVTPESLTVINSKLLMPEGNISIEGFYLNFATARMEARGTSEISLAALKEKVRNQRPEVGKAYKDYIEKLNVKGKVKISAAMTSDKKGIDINGKARADKIELANIEIGNASTTFKATKEKLDIMDVTAGILGGSIKADISLSLKEGRGFKGKARIVNIDLEQIGRQWTTANNKPHTGGFPRVSGRVSGNIDFTGGLRPEAAIDARSEMKFAGLNISRGDSSLTKIAEGSAIAQTSYSRGMMRIISLALKTLRSNASFHGNISGGRVSLVADIDTSDMSELYKDIAGAGTLKGNISGPIGTPVMEGNINLAKFASGRYHADGISGNIRLGRQTIGSTGIKVEHGETAVFIKGDVSLKKVPIFDLAVASTKGRLEDITSLTGIDMDMKGEFSATGRVKGELKALDGEVDIKGKDVRLMGESMDTIDISGRLVKGGIVFEKGEVARNSEALTFNGKIGHKGDMDIRIPSSIISIENLSYIRKSKVPLKGILEVRGDLSGSIKNPSFKGSILLNDTKYKDFDLGEGHLFLSMADKKMTAYGNAFGSEIEGDLTISGNNPFHVRLKVEDISLYSYLKKVATLQDVTGSISGTVEIEGDLLRPQGISARGRVSKLQLVRDPFFLGNAGDIEIEMKSGKIIFKSLHLTGRGTDISSSGWIGIDGDSNLGVVGNIDLYILQLFTKAIEKGEGVADIQLHASGKPPKLEGKITVREGGMVFKGLEPVFSGISGSIGIKRGSLIVERLAGKIGEGRFKGSGIIDLEGISPKRTDLLFDLTGVQLAYPKWLPSEVEGTLRLSGQFPDLLLGGDMNVVKARYSERVDWRSLIPSLKRRLAEPRVYKGAGGVLKIDINFKADKNLIFDNNIGKGELKGEIKLKGDASGLGVAGQIEVMAGAILYKEHEFKVTSGIIEFPDSKKVEAVLDFMAEGRVRDYLIQIQAQGNINDLKVAMTSFPPLSEVDIASLLTFGLTPKELQEKGGGAPAYGAVSFLTREVEGKFKDYIGFDRFHIDTYYSRVTGTTEPKLTVGKEISEDVSVLYSRGLSGTGEQEVQMEYKIYRNFSLVGGWSSFGESNEGDIGADMKVRFEFR